MRLAWMAWIVICLVWGTTYLAIKVALEGFPPFVMGGLRSVTAGIILGVVVKARGHTLPDRSQWSRLVILGLFMVCIANGGVVYGELYIPTGLTAVLIATTPFWMVGVDAVLRDGKQLFARQWTGLLVGFAGIVLLVWPDIFSGGGLKRGFAVGIVAVQLSCLSWAIGSAYSRRTIQPRDVLSSSAALMFFGGLWMLLIATLTNEWPGLHLTGRSLAAVLWLTVAGSVVAFTAYSYALQHLDVAIVSLYTYINPVIAVALGVIVLGEPFSARMLFAAGVILVGMVIVRPSSRKAAPDLATTTAPQP